MCQTTIRRNLRRTSLVTLSWLLCCASAYATGLGYNVTEASSSGPPYPAVPMIEFDVFHLIPGGPTIPLHNLGVQLFDASTPVNGLPLDIRGMDSGVGDAPGPIGMIDVLSATSPDDNFPADSFFDVFIDVDVSSNILDQGILSVGDNFFDVFFDVEVNSNALHIASFQFPHPELLIFVTPVVVPNENGIHVQFGVRRTDGVPLQELFSIELHGHFIPEPSTFTLASLALLSLIAHRRRRR